MYPDDFDHYLFHTLDELKSLPINTQVACCILMLEAQVNNGGFHQYFSNSTGLFVNSTLDALGKIGALKTKGITERAISIAYKNGYPNNPELHERKLREDDTILDDLYAVDKEFYSYQEPLSEMVNTYLSNHH